MRKPGAKTRIREFLLANIGKVVNSIQIRDAAGVSVSEWARRVRELRDDEKWPILTHNDTADLKPGQYLLQDAPLNTPRFVSVGQFQRSYEPRFSIVMVLPAKCAG